MRKIFNLVLILLIACYCEGHWIPSFAFGYFPRWEGQSSCLLPSGGKGICKKVDKCPETTPTSTHPTRCGYSARICCPIAKPVGIQGRDQLVIQNISLLRTAAPEFQFDCGISTITVSDDWVVGGEETSVGQYPWMALVGKNESEQLQWICDGVLIHPQWVVSAAHCFLDPSSYVIRLGEHDINDPNDGPPTRDVEVSEVIFHPEFKVDVGYHDLVLLQLRTPVKLHKYIKPVCLPWKRIANLEGKQAILSGWGAVIFGGSLSNVLRHAEVTMFNASVCNASYSVLPNYNMVWPQGITGKYTICAGNINGGIDSCQGDSGGPLVIRDTSGRFCIIGLISKGFGCGIEDFPGLYVSVTTYLQWIIEEIISKTKNKVKP